MHFGRLPSLAGRLCVRRLFCCGRSPGHVGLFWMTRPNELTLVGSASYNDFEDFKSNLVFKKYLRAVSAGGRDDDGMVLDGSKD